MGLFRKKQVKEEILLSEGIVMKEPLTMETSSWLRNCMAKSLLVFSIVFGTIGCFLSSFQIDFLVLPTAVLLFLMALLFTSIYYRGWLMDLVYIIFFAIFVLLVQSFRVYINSGFYILVNAILREVENYFELPGMQYYEIQAENQALAVTIAVMFIGTVMMILTNVEVSRMMNLWIMLIESAWIWIFPLFFRLEPDAVYVVLMVSGYLAVWAIHSSGAYGMDPKHRDYRFKDKKGKKLKFWYMQDAATMLETLGLFVASVILIYGITSMVQDKDTFNLRFKQNPRKEASERFIQLVATRGATLFDRYASTGGISEGQLGGVGSVSPDYQTDLVVTFAPYSYDPVYLKAYTGVFYDSAASRWKNVTEEGTIHAGDDYQNYYYGADIEEANLASRYASYQMYKKWLDGELVLDDDLLEIYDFKHNQGDYSDDHVAKSIMLIQNRGANENFSYAPYYALAGSVSYISDVMTVPQSEEMEQDNVPLVGLTGKNYFSKRISRSNEDLSYQELNILHGQIGNGQYAVYEYYPLVWEPLKLKDDLIDATILEQNRSYYMDVPEECRAAVEAACAEAGITESDSMADIVAKVQSFLETEFSYTTRPGKVPEGEDFITHFLEERRGYCVYFASTAVMMLRYSGVPARYIEGYVITFDDILTSGELNEEYDYADFYEGYNPLGETAVLDVNVTDARAHAWVEYFDNSFGWRQAEVTTAAVEPEEEQDSFWDAFAATRDSEGGLVIGDGLTLPTVDLDMDDLRGIWIALIIVLLILILIAVIRRVLWNYREYKSWHTDNLQENVLAYYHIISEHLRKKEPAYQQCPTYQSQLSYMQDHCREWNWDSRQIAKLLERAGYSRQGIGEFDCKRLMIELEDIDQKVKKWKKYRR